MAPWRAPSRSTVADPLLIAVPASLAAAFSFWMVGEVASRLGGETSLQTRPTDLSLMAQRISEMGLWGGHAISEYPIHPQPSRFRSRSSIARNAAKVAISRVSRLCQADLEQEPATATYPDHRRDPLVWSRTRHWDIR
jgi:hypothetical protein